MGVLSICEQDASGVCTAVNFASLCEVFCQRQSAVLNRLRFDCRNANLVVRPTVCLELFGVSSQVL
jgi:hypothetical protein